MTHEWSPGGVCELERVAPPALAAAVNDRGWVEAIRLGGHVEGRAVAVYSEEFWRLLRDGDQGARARGKVPHVRSSVLLLDQGQKSCNPEGKRWEFFLC